MKKCLIIIALLLGVAVVAAVVVKREFFPAPGVTVQNFKRLHGGMKFHDIEAILGHTGELCENLQFCYSASGGGSFAASGKRWIGENCVIEILFLNDPRFFINEPLEAGPGICKVSDRSQIDLSPWPESMFDRIRAWLGI